MRTTVKMPKLGDAVDEVVVLEICVSVGDLVSDGQELFVVETDKVTTDVPSPVSGRVLEVLVGVDDSVRTGQQILVVEV